MIARGSKRKTRKKRGGVKWKKGDIIWKTILVNDPNRPNIPIERRYYKIMDINARVVGEEGKTIDYILLRRVKQNGEPWLTPDQRSQGKTDLGSTGGTGNELNTDEDWRYLDQFWEVEEVAKRRYKLFNTPGTGATHSGGGKRTRRKKGGNGKDNKTKEKKATKCDGIRNIFGVCIKAANKTSVFNKGVIDAQDTSLGQFKTDNATTLMGFPSGKGGGRTKKGGLLGPRELEEGRQYLYNGPEPHFMPQAEWPDHNIRITVTYRGRNVQGLTPNQNYFDGEREIARDGHSLDIFSLDAEEIRQRIQPWFQNPGPSRVTNPSGVSTMVSKPRTIKSYKS